VKQRAAGFDLVLPHNPAKIDKRMRKTFGKKCGLLNCPKNTFKVKQRAASSDLVSLYTPAKIYQQLKKVFNKKFCWSSCHKNTFKINLSVANAVWFCMQNNRGPVKMYRQMNMKCSLLSHHNNTSKVKTGAASPEKGF